VRHLCAHVEAAGHALERVEVLREGLPAPRDAFGERGSGDVLDALHQLDQPVLAARPHWREADATVAHHHGGDAVPARRREQRVPGDLAVVVRVEVDEPGRDQQAVGVDDLLRRPVGQRADLRDAPLVDGDVGLPRRRARAVGERAPSDHQVVHRVPFPCAAPRVGGAVGPAIFARRF
jgi:hypothetical protein